ncbi:MAG: hypothetical protein QXH45_07135 [Thermosphaera sp.]
MVLSYRSLAPGLTSFEAVLTETTSHHLLKDGSPPATISIIPCSPCRATTGA